ncbi:acetyl-coenzyme A synthetase [Cokeromyces recurvatus]|uniref:acetyl-coenzyme A synthetase n=1 Tax=Cokeromyces recurvatus TaxID=90255 RepID=UPI00221E6DD4|nr:acetyl-coenzyme A synthetase [Cokeromyces recurvatus]KAI7905596.1 acetyl-coenzyme A synthetase [Cokeromyces recurvatus]
MLSSENKTYPVPERLLLSSDLPKPYVNSFEQYKQLWEESIENPKAFFTKAAKEYLSWHKDFETVMSGDLKDGNIAWFLEGELNACYNCVDRHALKTPNKIAIIHEGDNPNNVRKITYYELMQEVCRMANVLYNLDVRKGDTVVLYMPMIPETIIAMLACARIGAIHSVVFAGFSAESLYNRIEDCKARILITADEGLRGGKRIHTKRIVDEALQLNTENLAVVERVIVVEHTGSDIPMMPDRDVWWHDEMAHARPYWPVTYVNSEDPLFMLYTSGSTGKPKGVLHTTGGYLLGAAMTVKNIFDVHENDIYACMADIGWITGHTYIVYGPLTLGTTTLLFESTPTYPSPSRFWETVDKHKITQFYTAPTAIRALQRLGDQYVDKCDLSSLRIIGSVGEPINPEAWEWYYHKVGHSKCAVVDTYWQTETGSIAVSSLPGAIATKPGSATFPFFGILPAILDPTTGKELKDCDVEGVLAIKKPWPSMARTIYNDHDRFIDTYLKPYPGYYFTGDGAYRDKDGYIWIRGRVDDVINVSGHRLSTSEIESALISDNAVAEAAVIGGHDNLTGQCIHAFCILKPNIIGKSHDLLTQELITQVRKIIGPFAKPKRVYIVNNLPKTRSGKIVRRILRKIINNEADQIGDTSTIAEPHVIEQLIKEINNSK